MKKLVIALFVLLLFLHQDFWFWDDQSLWLGFLPAGLAYHMLFSLATAGFGLLAVRHLWPDEATLELGGEEGSQS